MSEVSKSTLIREYSFKFLYHINLALFAALESSQADEKIQNIIDSFDATLEEFDNSYSKSDSEHTDNTLDLGQKQKARDLILGVLNNFSSNVDIVAKLLTKTTVSKVEKIDLCCLLVAIHEINNLSTPKKVALNEAILIAKKYGGSSSPKFVNGILDKVINEGN
ncbi:MAG: transcription antitermination protein NusB [Bacteriovoracaceae bacterium]